MHRRHDVWRGVERKRRYIAGDRVADYEAAARLAAMLRRKRKMMLRWRKLLAVRPELIIGS
jgi:hypothetical protein